MFDFLHADWFLKFAGGVCLIAVGVKHLLPTHSTIVRQICDGILGAGISLGVYSTTGRTPAA